MSAGLLLLMVMSATAQDRVLVVIAPRDFDYQEFRLTRDFLERSRVAYVVASSDTRPALADNDSLVCPAVLLKNVDVADYTGIILIGGAGSVIFWDDTTLKSLLRRALAHNRPESLSAQGRGAHEKVIGAMGVAPLILVRAGFMRGRTVAVVPDRWAVKLVADAGARFTFHDVAEDGPFITARGSAVALKFLPRFRRRMAAR